MKIFLDTCDVEAVRRAETETRLVSGVTTNPTLAKKANRPDYRKVIEQMCHIGGITSVSAQVREDQTAEKMAEEGKILNKICPGKVTVKVPLTPQGLKAVKLLFGYNIPTNVTLDFDCVQASLAMKAGARFVSLFIGRLEDRIAEKFHSGSYAEKEVMRELRYIMRVREIYKFQTQVLAASIRTKKHVKMALLAGVDVVSVPPDVFWEMFVDPLGQTKAGLEKFLKDREFLTG